ncbi:uncharacterized protein LOC116581446 [Mustela erminea]|uniref:uncharacterized protein LOC116581446 n=1 Tax=Mustela erminea TaxID=36723 RepID=UPI0013874430|nr:uncharacterized protein LOC116581446 [Mustela erminea]
MPRPPQSWAPASRRCTAAGPGWLAGGAGPAGLLRGDRAGLRAAQCLAGEQSAGPLQECTARWGRPGPTRWLPGKPGLYTEASFLVGGGEQVWAQDKDALLGPVWVLPLTLSSVREGVGLPQSRLPSPTLPRVHPRSRTGLLRALPWLVTVPLWTEAVIGCTLSQVFQKTWLSYLCRLLEREAEVTSLLLSLACLAITEHWLLLVPGQFLNTSAGWAFRTIPSNRPSSSFQRGCGGPGGHGPPFLHLWLPGWAKVTSSLVAGAPTLSGVEVEVGCWEPRERA